MPSELLGWGILLIVGVVAFISIVLALRDEYDD